MNPNLSSIRAFAVDGDGVLYRGDAPLPGLVDFFAFLAQKNIPVTLVTNNATQTRQSFSDKLARFGVQLPPENIVTASIATAEYLKTQFAPGTPMFVIGEGARHAIEAAGFALAEQDVAAVVVGMDTTLTYATLRTATVLIHRGAAFIGTNPDVSFPFEGGLAPGNGAILAALETATGVKPFIVGKPYPPMFVQALKIMGTDAAHTAMVGDRLETDILGGQNAGLRTIAVLSGVTSAEMLAERDIRPDWVFGGLPELLAALRSGYSISP